MVHTQPERLKALAVAGPMLGDEAQRGPALVQANVFQRCELVCPREYKRGCADCVRVVFQPVKVTYGSVDPAVSGVSSRAK
jgi:hypothetical protein